VILFGVVFLALSAPARAADLVVNLQDTGLGRVTSSPAGINCPPTCSAPFDDDSTVVLVATPAPGYAFGSPDPQGDPVDVSGWDGCAPVPGVPLRCGITVPEGESDVGASFRPAALLLVVANGSGAGDGVTARVANPAVGEPAERFCAADPEGGVVCPVPYLPGRAVTLAASPVGAPFPVWSDEDCADAMPCTVVLDELRRSITATFATQRVSVRVHGAGHVSSTPPGLDCTVLSDDDPPPDDCNATFQTWQDVALTAEGITPRWVTDPSPARAGCDAVAGAVCHVIAERARWAVVSFNGVPPDQQYPPKATAHFRVRRTGNGSGTVRGGGIDCGSRCVVERSYGDRIVLVADASSGSRFVRWRRGCGASARCPLTVGPTTRIGAVFARAAVATVNKLHASLKRVRVRRVRGRYRIVLPLHLNMAARVTARVTTRRGRRVLQRSWQVPAGDRRLVMSMRARRGRYRLGLTIRSTSGQVLRIRRPLRLR
jgi:hypothetical protein